MKLRRKMKLALISMQHSVPAMLMVMCTKQKKRNHPCVSQVPAASFKLAGAVLAFCTLVVLRVRRCTRMQPARRRWRQLMERGRFCRAEHALCGTNSVGWSVLCVEAWCK